MNIPESNGQGKIVPGDFHRIDYATHTKLTEKNLPHAEKHKSSIGYVPDAKLTELLSRLKQAEPVRTHLVAEAKQQLASGALLSGEAAGRTAASIIGIVEHF